MKFTPIDWSIYNKPPYFPLWLSRGETKKLVSYDDGLLADIDRHIGYLSNQYDLDAIEGVLLDLRGKLLNEKRNGNPDEIYRLFLRLRTMLNTADGTVNDIIKIIKFIFSSREVKIVPDYPAGLVIEYDGMKQEYLDYNSILAEVIAAGVGFHTRAMFDFIEDKIATDERMAIAAVANFVETIEAHDRSFSMLLSDLTFSDHVYGRSAIVYGGIQGGAHYNGIHKHNGLLLFQRDASRYKHNGEIVFGSGLSDTFASDDFLGEMRLDWSDLETISDSMSESTMTTDMKDEAAMGEELTVSMGINMSDRPDMSDELVVGMIGYWTYGGADNSPRSHDGSIGFNYGVLSPL
jgi:hypothetical protein